MREQPIELPATIAAYQDAHDRHDVDSALVTFAPDAVVHDEDKDWVGVEQIRQWLAKTNTEYTYIRTLLSVETTGSHTWLVRNRLDGNFPGGTVDLRYAFVLLGDRITRLTIAP
jgi:hypothetical protein